MKKTIFKVGFLMMVVGLVFALLPNINSVYAVVSKTLRELPVGSIVKDQYGFTDPWIVLGEHYGPGKTLLLLNKGIFKKHVLQSTFKRFPKSNISSDNA